MSDVDIDKLVAENPERYRVLSNGATYDMEAKRIVACDNSKNPHAITKENSMAMHMRRAELILEAQEAAREGIARHLGCETYLDAHGEIAGSMADLALAWKDDSKQARASVEAARLAAVLSGTVTERGTQQSSDVPAGGIQLNIGAEALQVIMDRVQKRRQELDQDIIDG
jgi:hypothetical protein